MTTTTAPTTDQPKSPNRQDRAKQIIEINVQRIQEGSHNPRIAGAEDKDALAMLAADMREQGQLQPIGVAANPGGDTFTVVWGSRRLKAAKLNGWDTILCVQVDEVLFDRDRAAASENLHRRPMTPLEELISVERLMARTPEVAESVRIDQAAAILGRSATWVRDRLYLKRLCAPVRKALMEGEIDLSQARQIAKIPDAKAQEDFWRDVLVGNRHIPTAEDLAQDVNRTMLALATVPWRLDAPDVVKGLPPCTTCPSNSDNDRHLFEHEKEVRLGEGVWKNGKYQYQSGAHCTNPTCFEKKSKAVQVTIDRQAQKAVTVAKVGPATKLKPAELKAMTTSAAAAVPTYIKPEAIAARVEAEVAAKTQKPTVQLSDSARQKLERERRKKQEDAAKARRQREKAIVEHLGDYPGARLLVWIMGNLGWEAQRQLAGSKTTSVGNQKGVIGQRLRTLLNNASNGAITLEMLEEVVLGDLTREYGKSAYQKAQEPYSVEARADMDRILLPESLWTGLAAKGPAPAATAPAKAPAKGQKGGKGK